MIDALEIVRTDLRRIAATIRKLERRLGKPDGPWTLEYDYHVVHVDNDGAGELFPSFSLNTIYLDVSPNGQQFEVSYGVRMMLYFGDGWPEIRAAPPETVDKSNAEEVLKQVSKLAFAVRVVRDFKSEWTSHGQCEDAVKLLYFMVEEAKNRELDEALAWLEKVDVATMDEVRKLDFNEGRPL